MRAFLSRRIDGIYLTGVIHTDETVRMLKRAGIPVVEGGNLTAKADRHGGRAIRTSRRRAAVTRYLVKRGFAKIGYIGAYPRDNDRARDRRRGYELALAAARRKRDPSVCVETSLDIPSGAAAMADTARPPSGHARRVLLGGRHRGRRAVRMSATATSPYPNEWRSPVSMTFPSPRRSCRR